MKIDDPLLRGYVMGTKTPSEKEVAKQHQHDLARISGSGLSCNVTHHARRFHLSKKEELELKKDLLKNFKNGLGR